MGGAPEITRQAGADEQARSVRWMRALQGPAPSRDEALERLYGMLLRAARSELRRRGAHRIAGPELDDLAHQATADALLAIRGKLDQFRYESRFTTWAYRFVVLEVSNKLGRHFRKAQNVSLDGEEWDRLPERFGFDPLQRTEWQELVTALRAAIDETLTARQRRLFVAIVLNEIPLDVMVLELGSNRNAIYKALFDARRKLRRALIDGGHLEPEAGGGDG